MLCITCWREVPPHLKRDVNRTWKRYNSAPVSQCDKALREYREAYDAALASIN